MIDIVVQKGDETDVQKWGLIDEMYNPKVGDTIYISGNPDFHGAYEIVSISEATNLVCIHPQDYPGDFIAQFKGKKKKGKIRKLVVEFKSETTPRILRGVWAFLEDYSLI